MYQVELKNGRTLKLNASQVKEMRGEINAFVLPAYGPMDEDEARSDLSEVYVCETA